MESDAAGPPAKRQRAGGAGAPAEQSFAEAIAAGPVEDEPDDEAERLIAKRAREELIAKRAGYRVFEPIELVGVVPDWMFTRRARELLASAGPGTAPGPGSQAAAGSQAVDAGYVLVGRSGEQIDLTPRGEDDCSGG